MAHPVGTPAALLRQKPTSRKTPRPVWNYTEKVGLPHEVDNIGAFSISRELTWVPPKHRR